MWIESELPFLSEKKERYDRIYGIIIRKREEKRRRWTKRKIERQQEKESQQSRQLMEMNSKTTYDKNKCLSAPHAFPIVVW